MAHLTQDRWRDRSDRPERSDAGRPLRRALVGLEGFVAVSAVYGGIGLAVNGMGMPRDWLDRTPFDSWVAPGVALVTAVAVPQALAALVMLRDREHVTEAAAPTARAGPTPPADQVSLAAGVALVAWILVQVVVLRRYFFLQPVIAGLGVVEALLARKRMRTL